MGQVGNRWDRLGIGGPGWEQVGQVGNRWDRLGTGGTAWE